MERNMLDIAKLEAEIGKLVAESAKLNAETAKISQETRWYLLFVGAAMFGAAAAFAKLFV